ncbi:MAG: hypothetical protein AAF389_05600 [Gemmatimonadota bacterium]
MSSLLPDRPKGRCCGRAGFVAINMMGPILGVVGLVALVGWFVGARWADFGPGAQLALKVLGGVVVVAIVVARFVASEGDSRPKGPRF